MRILSLMTMALPLALAPIAVTSPAQAAGCVSGAIVGGIAGHMVGHGKVGAAAGCAVGHHKAKKNEQVKMNNAQREQPTPQ